MKQRDKSSMEKTDKKALSKFLWISGRILFSTLLLVLLLRGSRIQSLLHTLQSVSLSGFLVAIVLFFSAHFITSVKWSIFTRDISILSLFKWAIIAHFYSILMVGQLSGDVMRVVGLRRSGNQTSSLIALTFYDRLTGLTGLLSITALCLLISPVKNMIPPAFYIINLLLFAFSVVVLISLIIINRKVKMVREAVCKLTGKLHKIMSWFTRFIDGQYGEWKKWGVSYLLSVLFHLLSAVSIAILARNILPGISIIDLCWVMGFTSILTMVPLSIGGLGIREAGFVGALFVLGVSRESAMALSLSVYAIQLTGALAGGILAGLGNVKKTE